MCVFVGYSGRSYSRRAASCGLCDFLIGHWRRDRADLVAAGDDDRMR